MPKKLNINNLKLGYADGRKASEEETKAFVLKLKEMSKKYEGTTPEDFMTLFIKENGLKDGVLLLDQDSIAKTNKQGGHAKGLIQFVPSTAKGLGLDQSKISKMSPVEQLEYVDKFYDTYKDDIKDYESLYLTTFYPAALGQSDDFVIADSDTVAYSSNKGIDKNKDGRITRGDFKKYANDTAPAQPKNLFSEVSDEDYTNSYDKLEEPPKAPFVVDEDDNFYYAKILYTDKDGEQRYATNPIKKKEGESVSLRKIGDGTYIVKSHFENGKIVNDYKKANVKDDGSGHYSPVKDKQKMYEDEMKNVLKNGATRENVEKAKDILDSSTIDFKEDGWNNMLLGELYESEGRMPYIQKDIENMRKDSQAKLTDLQSRYANATGDEREALKAELDKAQSNFDKSVEAENKTNELIADVKGMRASSGSAGYGARTTNVGVTDYMKDKKATERYDKYRGIDREYQKYTSSEEYKNYESTQEATTDLNKKPIASNYGSGGTKIDSETTTPGATTGTFDKGDYSPIDNMKDDPSDSVQSNAKASPYSEEYLNKQLKEIDEALAQQSVDPNTGEPVADKNWLQKASPLLETAGDVGRGLLGLGGALEETPVYEESGIFKEYIDDAYRRKDMGLDPEEMGLRKQLAERGFGYDVKNIRRLAGGSAGVALGNLGRASGTLQERYAQIGAEDSAVRRMNRARFDNAAVRGESVHRQKFEDELSESLRNKQAGAALVRDSIKNIKERSDFEQQYGEGSVYDQYQKELLASQRETRASIKQGRELRKDKYNRELLDQQEVMTQRLKDLKGQ